MATSCTSQFFRRLVVDKDGKPIFQKGAKCKVLREKKRFPRAFEVSKKLENRCRECIDEDWQVLVHPWTRLIQGGKA